MSRKRLTGFLSGSADLVCEHAGRYWILDWKSNHLGNRREDYLAPQLREAMLASDYVLQYCLYTLALHRQLRAQLPDYDPARHLGGVCYVFVRGVAAGSDSGLFTEAIDPQMAQALDEWTTTAGKEAGA
jgi:exodeoxyribonuclease V beta subunit